MKKNLALLMLFCGIAVASQAQFRFGLQGTPTFNWLRTQTPELESRLQLKFNYGLLIEKELADNYLISSGVFHNYDGGRFEFEDTTGATQTFIVKPQYLTVPVTLKMRTKEIGYFTYFARIGLEPGIRIKDDYGLEGNSAKADDFLDDPNENVSNFFKLSLNIALGAEYNLGGTTSFVAGLSFINNFTNMLNDEQSLFNTGEESINFNNIGLNVGIIF